MKFSLLLSLALACASVQGLSDVPSPENFLRRTTARAVVVGNYVYIDGGEIAQLEADGKYSGFRPSNGVNSTLSIDLSESWSSSNVSIKQIAKDAQPMVGHALWSDGGDTLYIWGGHASYANPEGTTPDAPASWKLTTDGQGGGKWSKELPNNPTLFNAGLIRSEDGAVVSTPSAAFWIGGLATPGTHDIAVRQPIPGMVSFNFTTKSWKNETAPAFAPPYGTVYKGSAQYIPKFGPNGLVMVLGGTNWALDPAETQPSAWMDFQNLTFFDPVTKDWHWQGTTGDAPTSREDFCVVGAEGKDGTYEIFVFGGVGDKEEAFDDVFILTLPGFAWTTVPYEPTNRRNLHTCVVAGRRQMLVVGGLDRKHFANEPTRDPWPQGLGLFDMTDLVWKTDYDAGAAGYETPQRVKDWYTKNGNNSVEWSSSQVKALFSTANSTESTNSTDATTGTDDPNKTDDGTNGTDDSNKKDDGTMSPVTAVVGGVIGGVAAAVIAAVVIWFLRRRKHRRQLLANNDPSEDGTVVKVATFQDSPNPTELDARAQSAPKELYSPSPPTELHSQSSRAELHSPSSRAELYSPSPPAELHAPVSPAELQGR